MHMLIEATNVHEVSAALRDAGGALAVARGRVESLLAENRKGCNRVVAMLRTSIETDEPAATIEDGIERCRRAFDQAVRQNEEASVALYSLASPVLLAEATREIVEAMAAWGVIGPDRDVLQIGCGIGRMEHALALRVRHAVGIDISPRMIEAALRRCAGIPNVELRVTDGRDLRAFHDQSTDLVYAVDSFPYLVQLGMSIVETHFEEAWRVLRPVGDLVILNFSYRGGTADRGDFARLSAQSGFDVIINGDAPFTLWDGAVFHARKTRRRANGTRNRSARSRGALGS